MLLQDGCSWEILLLFHPSLKNALYQALCFDL